MLQLILGKSGYGKTEYVFNSIKEHVDNDENVLLITPEQFSFVAERRLLTDLGEAKISKVQNMSFCRLNDEICAIYGADKLPVLSKGSKAVMMQKAALMVQDSLVLYANKVNQLSFVNSVVAIYDEMKSCRVSADDIYETAKIVENEKKILGNKLCDIATIMQAYDSLISGEYLDSATELTRLYEKLLTVDYFCDKVVFIDGFSGFIAQEYKVLEVIIKQAKKIYITFCSDTDISVDKQSLFYYVQRNIAILKEVASEAGVQICETIYLRENHRAANCELKLIENSSYFALKKDIDNRESIENVSIYSAKGICDECDNTAKEIVKLLRNGYKASDIAVICRDMDKYEKELEFSFSKFNVPYFDDERQNIASQPLIMFVNFLLRVGIYSMRSEDIFSMIKTGLTSLSSESISELENYVYLWNINGKKWNDEFVNSTKGFVETVTDNDKKKIESINRTREYIVERINKFLSNSRGRNCTDICKAIYFTIIDFECDEGIKRLANNLAKNGKSALADEQGRIWDLLMEILDKLATIGGSEKITLKDFYKLFNLMIANEDLGSIPTGLDNIQIGEANRIRCNNPKVVFILGANEGAFPHATTSSGLLSENDRISLINNKFKLYSYGEVLNAQEKYFAYMAMSAPSKKLYVSYIGEQNPSSIVTEIQEILPNIKVNTPSSVFNIDSIESLDSAFELYASNYNENSEFVASLGEYFKNQPSYSKRLEAVNKLCDNAEININDSKLATELFSKDMYLSASRIEDFYNCSFRYFCKFGLNARPRQRAEMDPMQTGTVVHYVMEQLIKTISSDGLVNLTSAQITIEVNKYLTEFLENKMGDADQFTPRFKYQFMRLSRLLIRLVERLKAEFEQSDFKARAFELEIGNNAPVDAKRIELPDGGSVSIRGAIDRVDTYTENDKQYVRVVDYKSNKEFRLSDVLHGLNLQMFIYLFTLCDSKHELSGIESGVLYMKSSRKIFSLKRNDGSNEIEKQENKGYKMIGLVLNDDENEIAQHMEREIAGKYIPVTIKKQGMVGDFASLSDLRLISRKIDSLIEQMGMSLHQGKVSQKPIYNKNHENTCEYCDYKSVCLNRKEIEPFEAEDLSTEEAILKLREDADNA